MVDSRGMDTDNWTSHVDVSQLCRVCALQDEHFIPIFEGHGLELEFEVKLLNYLYIKVSKDDVLPLQVCLKCSNTLLAWHDLVTDYKKADESLWSLLGRKEKEVENEIVLLDEDTQDSVEVLDDTHDAASVNLDDLLILPGKPQKDTPLNPRKDEKIQPTSPKKDEKTQPTSPQKDEKTPPTNPQKNEKTHPTSPQKDEKTQPTSPQKDEKTQPTNPKKDEKVRAASPKKDEKTQTESLKNENSTIDPSASSLSAKKTPVKQLAQPLSPKQLEAIKSGLVPVQRPPARTISGTQFKAIVKPFILSCSNGNASRSRRTSSVKKSAKRVATPSDRRPVITPKVSKSVPSTPVLTTASVVNPVSSGVNPVPTRVNPALTGVKPIIPRVYPGPTGINAVSAGVNPVPSGVNPVPSGVNSLPSGVNSVPTRVNPVPTGVNPVPTGVNPVPTGVNPVPTGVNPVPTGVSSVSTEGNPVPTRVNPVPTGVNPVPTGVNPVPSGVNPVPTGVIPVPTGVSSVSTEGNPVSAPSVVNDSSVTSVPQLPAAFMLAPTPGDTNQVITLLLPHNMITPANKKLIIKLPAMGPEHTGQRILVPNSQNQSTNKVTSSSSNEVVDLEDLDCRGPSPCPSDTGAEAAGVQVDPSSCNPVARSSVQEVDPISIVYEDHTYFKPSEVQNPISSQNDNKKTVKKILSSLKRKNEGRGCFVCGKVITNSTLLSQHERSHFKSLECISYNCSLCSKSFKHFQDMVSHRMEHETPQEAVMPVEPGMPTSEMPALPGIPALSRMPGESYLSKPEKPPKVRKKRIRKPRKPKPRLTEDDIDDECAEGVDVSALAELTKTLSSATLREASEGGVPAEGSEPNDAPLPEAQVVAERLQGAEVVVLDEGMNVVVQEDGLSSLLRAGQDLKKTMAVSLNIKCVICGFCFKSRLALEVHKKRKHTEEERASPYKCKECGKRFRTSGLLKTHTKIHGERPGELCFECGKIFKQKSSLRMHRRKHHDVPNPWPTYHCEHCPRKFDCRQKLSQHMNTHTGVRPFCCEKCGKSFYRSSNLRQHMATHFEVKPFICEICGQGFKWLKNLNSHSLVHVSKELRPQSKGYGKKNRGPMECNLCNKILNGPTSLKVHRYKFHREQFFLENPNVERLPCKLCNKVLSSALNLENHLKKYHPDGQVRFACDVCGKRFTTKNNRDDHMHIHTGERPYACPVCPKTFTSLPNLHAHRDAHTDERKWPCQYCDKSFKRKAHLDTHIRSHTGEKPYVCEICNRGFAQSNDRNKHRLTHSAVRPFQCVSCGAGFRSKRYLIRHIAKFCSPGQLGKGDQLGDQIDEDQIEEDQIEEDEIEEDEVEDQVEEEQIEGDQGIDLVALLGTDNVAYVTYVT